MDQSKNLITNLLFKYDQLKFLPSTRFPFQDSVAVSKYVLATVCLFESTFT